MAVLAIALGVATAIAAWTTARWRTAERAASTAHLRPEWLTEARPASDEMLDLTEQTPNGQLAGRSALIIDDDEIGRQVLERTTAGWGMRTMTAADGAGGLDVLERLTEAGQAVDVVLVDVDLPELDGLAVSRAIRAHHPILPKVVLFTSSTDLADVTRTEQAGIDARLAKPLRSRELHDAITTVLGVQEPADD